MALLIGDAGRGRACRPIACFIPVDKNRMKRFSPHHHVDWPVEFAVDHVPRITAKNCVIGRWNIRSGQDGPMFHGEPCQRAASGGVSVFVSIARPYSGIARLGIAIPDQSFVIFRALVGAVRIGAV